MTTPLQALSQLHESLLALHTYGLVSDDALEMLLGGEGLLPRLGVALGDHQAAEKDGMNLVDGEQVFIAASLPADDLLSGTTADRIAQQQPLATFPAHLIQEIQVPPPSPTSASTPNPSPAPPPLPNRRTVPPASFPIGPDPLANTGLRHRNASEQVDQVDLSSFNAMTLATSPTTSTTRNLPPPLPRQSTPPTEKKKKKGFGFFTKAKDTDNTSDTSSMMSAPGPSYAGYQQPQATGSRRPFVSEGYTSQSYPPQQHPPPPSTSSSWGFSNHSDSPPPQPQALTFNQRQKLARGEEVTPTGAGLQQDLRDQERREKVVGAGKKVGNAALGGAGFAIGAGIVRKVLF